MGNVCYGVIKSTVELEDGEREMYGVRGGYDGSEVCEFPALFTERRDAERFAETLTEFDVSPCHVMDIIVDGFACT